MSNTSLTDLLRASLEGVDIEQTLDNTEHEQVVTDQTETQIDEALNEVADASDALKQNEDVIEELEGAAATTESIVTVMEGTVEEGGMYRQTAAMQMVALESACRKLPIDLSKVTVAQESFGGEEDRLVATQEALEGAKKVLAAIWQAIKNAVTKAYEAVKNFFLTIGKGSAALKRGGQILKGKAKGMEKNGEFDATSYANSMHIAGKFDGVSTIEAGFKAYRDASAAELAGRATVHKSLVDVVGASLAANNDVEKLDSIVDEVISRGTDTNDAADKIMGIELPGGKKYVTKLFGMSQSKVSSFSGEAKVSVSKAQVEKLAGDVINFASFLEEAGKKAQNVVAEMNRVTDQTKKDVDASEDKARFAKLKLAAFDKLIRFGTRNLSGVPAGAAGFAKQALAFGSKAVSAAGGKAEAPKKDGDKATA